MTTVTVKHGEYNITNEAQSSLGCMDSAVLSGHFGSIRPPLLLSVTVDDADNGDEVFGYCDTLTFEFNMKTDKAGRESIDPYSLFYFANPSTHCDVPFNKECPVYDIANGLGYEHSWSADGSSYTVRLECPAPAGTPSAAAANNYTGAPPQPYLVGNNSATYEPYELKVAYLELGVTQVRVRADVRNTKGNLRQPLLVGEFGSVDEPYIVAYLASNDENADSVYGEGGARAGSRKPDGRPPNIP